jgi:phosphoribosylformylglycinamidine synthase
VLQVETGPVHVSSIYRVATPLDRGQLETLAREGLTDPIIEEAHLDGLVGPATARSYLLVARLPGVTDDEGQSAQETMADLLDRRVEGEQQIFSQTLYLFDEPLSPADLDRLGRELLGNPLVHHLEHGPFVAGETALSYLPSVIVRADLTIEEISLDLPDDALLALSKGRGLALSLPEMRAIRAHFEREETRAARALAGLPRWPTDGELEVLAQTWSEHCKHKEFNALIRLVDRETGQEERIDSLFKTCIRGATQRIQEQLAASGARWLVKVFTDNAGVVRVDDDRVFVFKVETHNSPSALDPYGGAITGILGNNRDPLGMGKGGGRLLFNTNVLCFGPPGYDRPLLPGQLHPGRVFAGVREGIQDGGNKSGVPTVNGSIVFDDRYAGKPLVFCGTGSIMPATCGGGPSWEKRILPGHRIVVVGGRVGKDGIHGATFSSTELDENSPRGAVQIGSPITQKRVADFLEIACARGLVACATDNGAGGLSSSIGELATLSGGARVELGRVRLKYAGLRPWEIFVSESQERMTLAVDSLHLDALLDLARDLGVEALDIGEFTDDGRLDVRHDGQRVVLLDLDFLHDGTPRLSLEAEVPRPALVREPDIEVSDHGYELRRLLGSLDVCSREAIIRQYDHEVKGKTVVKPLMGPRGKAPQDAAVLRLGFDSYLGLAVSNGLAPRVGDLDAYQSSALAFDEALRSLLSVGARLPDLTSTEDRFYSCCDNFCVPDSVFDATTNPDGKEKLGKLVQLCRALFDMATFFGVPLTSGKDSMKNDLRSGGQKISVPPTVLYSMVARVDDVRRAVTSEFKAAGDAIYLVGHGYDELGGSTFLRLRGHLGWYPPRVRKDEALAVYRAFERAHQERLVQSSHDLSDGGLAVTLAESCFGGGLGAFVRLSSEGLPLNASLYGESPSRFLVTVKPSDRSRFEELLGEHATPLGEVLHEPVLRVDYGGALVLDEPVDGLENAWSAGLAPWGFGA